MKAEPTYSATPAEIGRLRREIREQVRRTDGFVEFNVFLKAATLDESSWIWLRQRMRPRELALLDKMCPRATSAKNDR
jgi:Trm5-related predicted tRNA methylase